MEINLNFNLDIPHIFDFHTHFGEGLEVFGKKTKSSYSSWIEKLLSCNIKSALIMPGLGSQEELEALNLKLSEDIKNLNQISLYPFAVLKPENDISLLENLIKNHNFFGLKIIPVLKAIYNPKYRENNKELISEYWTSLNPLIEKADSLQIPVMIHTGWYPIAKIEPIIEYSELFPNIKFIIAHAKEEFGVNPDSHTLNSIKNKDNIHREISYIPHLKIVNQAVENFSSAQISGEQEKIQ